jgi:DNA-binding transcriptional MerR regulator
MAVGTGLMTEKLTWLDWYPKGSTPPPGTEWVTRDELLVHPVMKELGITTVKLRYWQYIMLVPKPLLLYRDNATHALYPPNAWRVFAYLKKLQDDRLTLREIPPLLKAYAQDLFEQEAGGKAEEDVFIPRVLQMGAEVFAATVQIKKDCWVAGAAIVLDIVDDAGRRQARRFPISMDQDRINDLTQWNARLLGAGRDG